MDQTNDSLLFSGRVHVNGTATMAEVTASGEVRWMEGGGGWRRLAVEKEVFGFSKDGCQVIVNAVLERGEGSVRSGGSTGATVRKSFVFEVEDEESCPGLCESIQRCIDSLGRPKRLFVLVNPFGGNKCASKIFLDDVKPLLVDANVEYTLQETKHRLHAKEVAFSLDLSKYDGIVCASGDGTLVEVVNGLLERADWENAIKLALGIIPAGTGNGMAKSLLDSVGLPCTAFHATLAVIRGHKRRLDVTTVLQGETKFFSVLMLAWGLVADIDIESEKYRWMGKARFEVYGLQRVLSLRKYNGCISFVPAPGFEGVGEPSDQKHELLCKNDEVQQRGYLGPDIDLGSSKWRTMNGPFVSVWLHNVPWGAEDTKAAPDAKFSDGYLDLIIIRDCPKVALLPLMTELSNGNHVKSPHVSYLKVKAFVLEPGSRTDDPTKGGIIDVDGEVLARGKGTYKAGHKALMNYDKLQLVVDHGLATIFTPN